jgi:hypothetical protein
MDYSTVASLISSYGFPIVACVIMGWYVKYTADQNREQLNNITEQHTKEMTDVTTALNNNTLALQKLCDKMEVQR